MIIDNKSYTGDGSTRQFNTSVYIASNSHIAVFIDNVLQPTSSYDLLGSVVLFQTAPAIGVSINFVISDTGEDLPVNPSEYNTVYNNITEIQNVSSISNQIVSIDNMLSELVTVFNNLTQINSVYNDKLTIDGLYSSKDVIDSLYSIKAKLDSLYADKATLDSLYGDKTALDTLYTNIASLLGIYDNLTAILSVSATDPTFDTVTLSGGTGTQGQISWNADEETLDLIQNGATLQLGQELQWHCRNNTASTIANGTPVMATGTIGASGKLTIAPMDGTVKSNAKYFLGIATENILAGEDGKITHFGKIRGIDTTGTTYGETWSDGQLIYISTTTIGALTNIEPTNVADMKIEAIEVIHAHTNGTLAVRVNGTDSHTLATEISYDGTSTTVKNAIDYKVDKVASTDNAIVRFDGTTGQVQNSGVIIDDSNNITGLGTINGRNISADGNKLDSAVTTSSSQALHSTDALRISGSTVYLYKGDGNYETVELPIPASSFSEFSSGTLLWSGSSTRLDSVLDNAGWGAGYYLVEVSFSSTYDYELMLCYVPNTTDVSNYYTAKNSSFNFRVCGSSNGITSDRYAFIANGLVFKKVWKVIL